MDIINMARFLQLSTRVPIKEIINRLNRYTETRKNNPIEFGSGKVQHEIQDIVTDALKSLASEYKTIGPDRFIVGSHKKILTVFKPITILSIPDREKSTFGIVYTTGLYGSKPLFIIKSAASPFGLSADVLTHEIRIGTYLNHLRDRGVINFMYTYGGFLCSPPFDATGLLKVYSSNKDQLLKDIVGMSPENIRDKITLNKKKPPNVKKYNFEWNEAIGKHQYNANLFCKNPGGWTTPLYIGEYIPDTMPFDKFLNSIRHPKYLHQVFLQTICAIRMAKSMFKFVHGDLRSINILIYPLDSPLDLHYKVSYQSYVEPNHYIFNKLITINTKYVVKIIDYGTSTVRTNNEFIRPKAFYAETVEAVDTGYDTVNNNDYLSLCGSIIGYYIDGGKGEFALNTLFPQNIPTFESLKERVYYDHNNKFRDYLYAEFDCIELFLQAIYEHRDVDIIEEYIYPKYIQSSFK